MSASAEDLVLRRIWQPAELFALMGVKNHDEAEKVLSMAYNLINYLKVGDEIETSMMKITKLDSDLFHISSVIKKSIVYDEIIKKKVIKLPV